MVGSFETPEQGAVREFFEETGICVEVIREVIRQKEVDTHKGVSFVTIAFLVGSDEFRPNVNLSDEHIDYQWINLRSVFSERLEVVWHLRPAIKELLDVKGGEKTYQRVSTLSDYVRLSVKGKCPLSRLPC